MEGDLVEDWVAGLEHEWDSGDGFVGKLRFGVFDEVALERLLGLLNRIDVVGEDCLPKTLVSRLWMMPAVMEWQLPHQQEKLADTKNLLQAIAAVRGEVERILGVP